MGCTLAEALLDPYVEELISRLQMTGAPAERLRRNVARGLVPTAAAVEDLMPPKQYVAPEMDLTTLVRATTGPQPAFALGGTQYADDEPLVPPRSGLEQPGLFEPPPVPEPEVTPKKRRRRGAAVEDGEGAGYTTGYDPDLDFGEAPLAVEDQRVYEPAPTMLRFHESNKKVRAILGPVGCLPPETEVLTPQGWVQIGQWAGQDIAEWDSETGRSAFRQPREYIKAPAEGFIEFQNEHSLDMVLSPTHRMPLYDWSGRFVVKTAQAVASKPSRHTVPTTWVPDANGVDMTDAQLRLWVAVAADGHYPAKGKQCAVVLRRERKVERLRAVLLAARVPWVEKVYPQRPTERSFVFTRPAHPKHFDWRLSAVTREQAEVMTDEMRHWDGLSEYSYDRFDTSREDQADIAQFLFHAAGRKTSMRKGTSHKPGHSPMWTLYPAQQGSTKNKVALRVDGTRIGRTDSSDGQQYCFVTATGFFVARHNKCVFITGNSGKSTTCCIEILSRAMRVPPLGEKKVRHSRWLVARSTYAELKSTTIKTFRYWLGHLGKFRFGSPITFEAKQALPDGTYLHLEVEFLPLDGEDAVKRLRSLEITGAWLNEGSLIEANHITEILGRLRFRGNDYPRDKQPWRGIIIDSNMPNRRHWMYEVFEKDQPSNHELFLQPPALLRRPDGGYDPNPDAENIDHLPDGYQYYFDMASSKDEKVRRKIAVLVLGEYGAIFDGKPVYDNVWSSRIHVSPSPLEPVRHLPLIIGMDWGLNPSVVYTQESGMGGIFALDEDCPLDLTLEAFLSEYVMPKIARRFAGMRIEVIGDPAGINRSSLAQKNGYQIVRSYGLAVSPAFTNDIQTRRDAVSYYLTRTGKFALDKNRCPTLLEGFEGGYRFKRRSGGEGYSDAPDKTHPISDVHDALQYAALRHYRPFAEAMARAGSRGSVPQAPVHVGSSEVSTNFATTAARKRFYYG
jgi:hypothetical protein